MNSTFDESPEVLVNRVFMGSRDKVVYLEGIEDCLSLVGFINTNVISLNDCGGKCNVVKVVKYHKFVQSQEDREVKFCALVDDDHDSILETKINESGIIYSDYNDWLIHTIDSGGLKTLALQLGITQDEIREIAYSQKMILKGIWRLCSSKCEDPTNFKHNKVNEISSKHNVENIELFLDEIFGAFPEIDIVKYADEIKRSQPHRNFEAKNICNGHDICDELQDKFKRKIKGCLETFFAGAFSPKDLRKTTLYAEMITLFGPEESWIE